MRLCVHPVRGISGGATYREMQPRGCQMKSLRPWRCGVKGKSLAGSFQQQTPKARFTSPQPKNDEENISKITRRSAEYAYLGYEPDDVNEVGGLHSTPRKEHQNIVSPGDAYGADKSRSTKTQRPTESQLPSGVELNRPTDITYSVRDISRTLNSREVYYRHRCRPRRVGENGSERTFGNAHNAFRMCSRPNRRIFILDQGV